MLSGTEANVLGEDSIYISEPITADIGQNRSDVAEREGQGARKHTSVEPLIDRRIVQLPTLPVIHGGPSDRDRLAALNSHDPAQIPIAEQSVFKPVPILANAAGSADGKRVHAAEDELIRSVKRRQRLLKPPVEKSLSTFDAPNQFIFSGVYALPVGRARGVGKNWNRFENALLGDWDLSGIVRIQSGQPVAIGRPSVNNGQSGKLNNPTIYQWFNTSVFSSALPFTFGNVGPVLPDVRSNGLRNVDAVLAKNVRFSAAEHPITVQFRTEFYNLLNN